jgi:hypothetical protein
VHPPPEANPPGLHLDAEWAEGGLLVRATNARAGHRLPTGDPERFVWIEVQAYDAAGAPVGPPFTHRVGQRWEWWPIARKLDDNRLAPGEVRELAVPLADGAVAARILASSHRMSEEAAAFHHLDGYPRSVLTHELWVRPDP